jgi:TatD DNase family protein
VPLDRLLLETDCPVMYQGQRSEPADVRRSLLAAAEVTGLPPDVVAGHTTRNAARLFGLATA